MSVRIFVILLLTRLGDNCVNVIDKVDKCLIVHVIEILKDLELCEREIRLLKQKCDINFFSRISVTFSLKTNLYHVFVSNFVLAKPLFRYFFVIWVIQQIKHNIFLEIFFLLTHSTPISID